MANQADGASQFGAVAAVFAPLGRDARVAATLLREMDVAAVICRTLPAFEDAITDAIWFAVVTEEAVGSCDLRGLAARINGQGPWSDLPFIVLTRRGGDLERNPVAGRLLEVLGNVTFLERPFHPTTFVSLARTAVRGRQRQFEARARIQELHDSQDRLGLLNETLEERVRERTAELEAAHRSVLAEIAQRERTEGLLRQAQKMEMIGQLTGGVAHDFNNLLMAVIANLDLLRKHIRHDPRATRLIDVACQGAQRGAALTQRLLAFARRQDLRVEPTCVIGLVRGMTDLLERSGGSAIELVLDLPETLPRALIDANQVELALLNLVVNARDAMPDGGVLTVAADDVTLPAGEDLPAGTYIRLIVRDTGRGMDAETLKKATEPFFSTKELGKGTGLGLSMVHGLAVQMNGALRLASTVGRGTVAELWLPVTELEAVAVSADPVDDGEEELPRMRILVVDDDVLIGMSTVEMLEDLGHEAVEANSGDRALEILRSDRSVDLLITDYAMPKMTGAQLARAAREIMPDLPVLLATGYAELPPGAEGDFARLAKPYHQDQLAHEITRLMKSGTPGLADVPGAGSR